MPPKRNLVGQVFGRLTVKEEIRKNGCVCWICKCECGNVTKPIATGGLTSGNTRSCGCLSRDSASLRFKDDLIGQVFGRLTVIEEAESTRNWHAKLLKEINYKSPVKIIKTPS